MKNYLLILPVAFLVAYSQIVIKWHTSRNPVDSSGNIDFLIKTISDPVVLSAFLAALLASFSWLFVVTKLPLSIAFPIYIGITFAIVVFGGWFFLNEQISWLKCLAIFFIFFGIVIGVKN